MFSPGAQAAKGEFVVTFVDVGQGDAMIGTCPDGRPAFVVDSGEIGMRVPRAPDKFRRVVKRLFGPHEEVPLVVATHPHSDHIGNLAWVFERFSVRRYLDNGQAPDRPSKTYRLLEETVGAEKEAVRLAPAGWKGPIDLCGETGVKVELLGPKAAWRTCGGNPNNCSVILRVDFGSVSFLLMGDAEREEEAALLTDCGETGACDVDVLKAGHHGSESSTGPDLLKASSPKVVVVSSGRKDEDTNRGYKHPRMKVVNAILSVLPPDLTRPQLATSVYDSASGAWAGVKTARPIYLTAFDGDVIVRTDGREVRVETEFAGGKAAEEGKAGKPESKSDGACVIKGNIGSGGEKIYHVPGGRYYNLTVIDAVKGERMFCTEEEAVKAGFRKAKR